jgi:hypothetical protein
MVIANRCPGCGVREAELHKPNCPKLPPELRADEPDNTGRKQDGTFAPGVSGNPAGRPKSARSKLSEDFFKALAEDFAENGVAAISSMRLERPGDYAKMIAALQTKEIGGEDGGPLTVILNKP